MYLYLVQHGEAKNEAEDPARPLTEKGIRDVRKVASFVSSNTRIDVECIYHSGKMRAAQTAGIFAEYIQAGKGSSEAEGLAPMDDPAGWAERLRVASQDVMIVGHLPHLSRLSSLLLCGNPEAGIINFNMGGVVCLKRSEGRWALEWMVVPEILKE